MSETPRGVLSPPSWGVLAGGRSPPAESSRLESWGVPATTPTNVLYPPSDPTFRYPSNVYFAIGNIAGDDRKEIVAIASADKGDRLVSYSLTGNGFQAATLADLPRLSTSRIAVPDMTGDNAAEIILLDGLTVTFKINEGGRFRSEQSFNINSSNASLHEDVTPFESGSPPDHLSVVDANSDGLPDLFLGREYSAVGGAAAGFLMNSGSCR